MGFNDIRVLLNDKEEGMLRGVSSTWYEYLEKKEEVYAKMLPNLVNECMVSEANFMLRASLASGKEIGINVKEGDICYLDYGQAYLNEMGYQHFGIVMKLVNEKAMVIPMSSNRIHYKNAFDPIQRPNGKKHLMRIGQPCGLTKPSVLFLNDIRFVNTARIIGVFAHIEPSGNLFKSIQLRVRDLLFLS